MTPKEQDYQHLVKEFFANGGTIQTITSKPRRKKISAGTKEIVKAYQKKTEEHT